MYSKYSAAEIEALLDKINSMEPATSSGEVGIPTVYPGPVSNLPKNKHLLDKKAMLIADYPDCYATLGGASSPYGVNTSLGIFFLPEIKEGGSPVQSGPNFPLASEGGSSTHTNTETEMFPHWHFVASDGDCQDWLSSSKQSSLSDFNSNGSGDDNYKYHFRYVNGSFVANEGTSSKAGGSNGVAQPYSIMNPYTAMNWVIMLKEKLSTDKYGLFSFDSGECVNALKLTNLPTSDAHWTTYSDTSITLAYTGPGTNAEVSLLVTTSYPDPQDPGTTRNEQFVTSYDFGTATSGSVSIEEWMHFPNETIQTIDITSVNAYVPSDVKRSFTMKGCYINDSFVGRTSLANGTSIVSMLSAFSADPQDASISASDFALMDEGSFILRVIRYIAYIKQVTGYVMFLNPGDAESL